MNPTNRIYPLEVIRTLALHVQGLATKLDIKTMPTSEIIYNTIKRIGCVQIDTLSVVQRSQYLVLWSRLGQFNIDDSDKLLFGDQAGNGNNRRLFEYWLHGASIIPLDSYRYRLPVMRQYKEQGDKWNQGWSKKKENVALMNNILERIKRDGPIRSADFENDGPKRGSWWDWKPVWNFCQVLEAYKPESSRKWGYFCLPILYHDKLVGRFDPKLDRKTNTLYLKVLYLEHGIRLDEALVNAIAKAMRDFMKFHSAIDLVIERSEPLEFRKKLLAMQ